MASVLIAHESEVIGPVKSDQAELVLSRLNTDAVYWHVDKSDVFVDMDVVEGDSNVLQTDSVWITKL